MDKTLTVSLSRTFDGAPLAVVENLPGGGGELRPAQLRALATTLQRIADDCEEYGTQVIVVQTYRLYAVLNDAGAYPSAAAGKRINYQSGYVVGRKGSEHTFFARACQLTRDDCKPAHLCLVASRTAVPCPAR